MLLSLHLEHQHDRETGERQDHVHDDVKDARTQGGGEEEDEAEEPDDDGDDDDDDHEQNDT